MVERHTPTEIALASQIVITKIIESLDEDNKARIADSLKEWLDSVNQSQTMPYNDCSMPSIHDLVSRIYQDTTDPGLPP